MTVDGSDRRRAIEGRAPSHDRGSTRLLLSPGPFEVRHGPTPTGSLVVQRGHADGDRSLRYRGSSLVEAVRMIERELAAQPSNAVWITDRSYLLSHWTPGTVRAAEARLDAAAGRVDAVVLAWSGPDSSTPDAARGSETDDERGSD